MLYMAQRQIGAIAERLIASGRTPDEAVALIADASTPRQAVTITTLRAAGRDAAVSASPLLIVIGPVVALRPMLAGCWAVAIMSHVSLLQRVRFAWKRYRHVDPGLRGAEDEPAAMTDAGAS